MTTASQIRLRKEVDVLVCFDQGQWWCEWQEAGVLACGDTREAAGKSFMEEIAITYDGLVGQPDKALTKGARIARDAIIKHVEIVEEEKP